MRFEGKNGGLAMAIRSHILIMRAFAISLIICIIPAIILLCIHNPHFYIFLVFPPFFLVLSFIDFAFIKYNDKVFLSNLKTDHIFEIQNNTIYKDGKEIKLIQAIKIYRYKGFLYMETSHSTFIIKDTDYAVGDRKTFLTWAKSNDIKVLFGY